MCFALPSDLVVMCPVSNIPLRGPEACPTGGQLSPGVPLGVGCVLGGASASPGRWQHELWAPMGCGDHLGHGAAPSPHCLGSGAAMPRREAVQVELPPGLGPPSTSVLQSSSLCIMTMNHGLQQ